MTNQNELPDLPSGIYKHYKGPLYFVFGYGHDADYEDRTVVVYIGLELDGAKSGARLAVRTAEDFLGDIELHPGGFTPRFTYLGPILEL